LLLSDKVIYLRALEKSPEWSFCGSAATDESYPPKIRAVQDGNPGFFRGLLVEFDAKAARRRLYTRQRKTGQ